MGKECIITNHSDFSGEIIINENNIDTHYSKNPIHMNSKSDKKISLPKGWFNDLEEYFALRVKDDSMIGADINSGDIVVLKK